MNLEYDPDPSAPLWFVIIWTTIAIGIGIAIGYSNIVFAQTIEVAANWMDKPLNDIISLQVSDHGEVSFLYAEFW